MTAFKEATMFQTWKIGDRTPHSLLIGEFRYLIFPFGSKIKGCPETFDSPCTATKPFLFKDNPLQDKNQTEEITQKILRM